MADEATVVRLPERFEAFYDREYHRVVGFAYAVAGELGGGRGRRPGGVSPCPP
jgi:hypothetical protein